MPWPDDMVALPEKGTMFSIEVIGGDSEAPPRFWTADAALVPDGRTFPTGVAGHYMIIGKEAEHRQAPFKITFSNETDDAIILAFSSVGATTSLKGVSVPTLTSWTPPKSTKEPVDEAVMLSTWKLPLNSVQSVEELTDTETCKRSARSLTS